MKVVKKKRMWDCHEYVGVEEELANVQARMAERFVERWAIVAGMPDGEDSAGRQKLRLMTPDELVTRACETATKLVEASRANGWLIPVPGDQFEEDKDDEAPAK